jgi:hypothetical protein
MSHQASTPQNAKSFHPCAKVAKSAARDMGATWRDMGGLSGASKRELGTIKRNKPKAGKEWLPDRTRMAAELLKPARKSDDDLAIAALGNRIWQAHRARSQSAYCSGACRQWAYRQLVLHWRVACGSVRRARGRAGMTCSPRTSARTEGSRHRQLAR